ncbi:MAG TPA: hypothetical protein VF533_18975 [Solirubrobacteraceae bacterium]|jgi:cell wall-associated NlpC family hydrolase
MLSVLRRLLPLALALLLAAGVATFSHGPSPAAGQSLSRERAAAGGLSAQVAAESRRIAATRAGIAEAQQRLAVLAARVKRRWEQLKAAQDQLVRARAKLTRLQRREAAAKHVLADNLANGYKAGRPNFVGVIMSADGFADLLERVEFLKRVSRRNADVLDTTREARAATAHQARLLDTERARYAELAQTAMAERDRADVLRVALMDRAARQERRRAGVASQLAAVRSRIGRIERRRAAAARAARTAATAAAQAPSAPASTPSSGGGGGGSSPEPPAAGGGDAVARVIAAASQIASTPYVWGGGHGGPSGGYDCSGSISYALAAGGLLASPLDSTGFMSWGEAGPGRRITVYANAGHAFMIVDGRRYDTSALSGGGTRWTSEMRSTVGFVARHPPGL